MVKERGQPIGSQPIFNSGANSVTDTLPLVEAMLKTIAYADIFDYPLKAEEIHRYLVGTRASLAQVQRAMQKQPPASSQIKSIDGYFMLRGRESIYRIRQKREKFAAQIWPRAIHYGRMIAALPYTRMVAITGALAVSNVNNKADIDFFIVTQHRRIWLCRTFVILLVHYIAKTKGDVICPNYFISERTLTFDHRSLYTAHELAQMIPIAGMRVYRQLRNCNSWIADFLPNAADPPSKDISVPAHTSAHPLRWIAERTLGTKPGDWLERWEMERKIRKFRTAEDDSGEAAFCADWCKGHFESHGERTLAAYNQRIRLLGLVP